MANTQPTIAVDFADRYYPVAIVEAQTQDADGFTTNMTCLHGRSGAVAYGAYVVVVWDGSGRRADDSQRRSAAASDLAERVRKLGYVNVRVEKAKSQPKARAAQRRGGAT